MLSTNSRMIIKRFFPFANKLRLKYLRFRLKGNEVFCVCCNSVFKKFAPFGAIKRDNAWCPQCESLERDRLLWLFLQNRTNIYEKEVNLLHVAPERILYKKFSNTSNINYFPVDKFNELYPKGTQYLDLLDNNLPDHNFDVIICNHVFQYIENDKKAMCEVYRLLKKGGWAILQVPINAGVKETQEDLSITDPKIREKLYGLSEHVRYYGLDYKIKLSEAGFSVTIDDYTKEFTDEEIAKYGFWKGDPIYLCTKI